MLVLVPQACPVETQQEIILSCSQSTQSPQTIPFAREATEALTNPSYADVLTKLLQSLLLRNPLWNFSNLLLTGISPLNLLAADPSPGPYVLAAVLLCVVALDSLESALSAQNPTGANRL